MNRFVALCNRYALNFPAFLCSFFDISKTRSAPTFRPLLGQPRLALNILHEVTRNEKLEIIKM